MSKAGLALRRYDIGGGEVVNLLPSLLAILRIARRSERTFDYWYWGPHSDRLMTTILLVPNIATYSLRCVGRLVLNQPIDSRRRLWCYILKDEASGTPFAEMIATKQDPEENVPELIRRDMGRTFPSVLWGWGLNTCSQGRVS